MDVKGDEITKKLEKITQKIVRMVQPEKIILFGSYASGNPTTDSDVDLFVIKDTDEDQREMEINLRVNLFPAGVPLDLLVYTPHEVAERLRLGDFFISHVMANGKLLYDRSS